MRKVVTAGQAIVDGLVRNGVRHIFGIPGVHTYSLIDALAERQGEIAYLGTRHEQGAAYMAYGYAWSSGRVGAYTCVPGPGVLNTSAALCTAYAANAPVLCLTSEVFSHEIGRGHGILHELPDQLAILRGLTKWSARISHPGEAPRLVARAFEELTSGRRRDRSAQHVGGAVYRLCGERTGPVSDLRSLLARDRPGPRHPARASRPAGDTARTHQVVGAHQSPGRSAAPGRARVRGADERASPRSECSTRRRRCVPPMRRTHRSCV